MIKKLLTLCLAVLILAPVPVYAKDIPVYDASIGCELINSTVPSLGCLTIVITNIINIMTMFLGGVALIFMLWGVLLIIISRGDAKALEKGKKTFTFAIFGVIAALFIFIGSNIVAMFLGIPNPLQNFNLYVP